MESKELKEIFHQHLKPLNFRKKGNYWRLDSDEIEKIINLQASSYSRKYYVNYGFNLKNLDYDGLSMHIFNRLEDSDAFDLENQLSSDERISKLDEIIELSLLPKINQINTENDILRLLGTRIHLNDIPLKVKAYLNLK